MGEKKEGAERESAYEQSNYVNDKYCYALLRNVLSNNAFWNLCQVQTRSMDVQVHARNVLRARPCKNAIDRAWKIWRNVHFLDLSYAHDIT